MYEMHPDADVIFHLLNLGSGPFLQSFFRSLEIIPAVSGVTLFSGDYPNTGDLSRVFIAHNNSCHYDY
ncbi:hypothetical protein CRE_19315 [Caenorhabditis remanei]|uniref:Uncharacterized protein n=1 Tax=Caenorhabditis remanei TaxID=31234 RepID=E3MX71_CAERE|nr:hypothetical protein CRE_19315 [Caenorhabditis remanei]